MIFFLIPFLLLIWWLNKNSKSDFFHQKKEVLQKKLETIVFLYIDFGFTNEEIEKLKEAYNYFIDNPFEYNGTSVINDRYMIQGFEPQSVVHDFDYIFAKNFIDLVKSNYNYSNSLRKVNANWLWVWGVIFIGLNVVSIFKGISLIFKNK